MVLGQDRLFVPMFRRDRVSLDFSNARLQVYVRLWLLRDKRSVHLRHQRLGVGRLHSMPTSTLETPSATFSVIFMHSGTLNSLSVLVHLYSERS